MLRADETGLDILNDAIINFVSVTSDEADTTPGVDPDGNGSYTDIAVLFSITAGSAVTVIVDLRSTEESLIVA